MRSYFWWKVEWSIYPLMKWKRYSLYLSRRNDWLFLAYSACSRFLKLISYENTLILYSLSSFKLSPKTKKQNKPLKRCDWPAVWRGRDFHWSRTYSCPVCWSKCWNHQVHRTRYDCSIGFYILTGCIWWCTCHLRRRARPSRWGDKEWTIWLLKLRGYLNRDCLFTG